MLIWHKEHVYFTQVIWASSGCVRVIFCLSTDHIGERGGGVVRKIEKGENPRRGQLVRVSGGKVDQDC